MAQEIPSCFPPAIPVQFLFAMCDNGDDACGNPLERIDRHVPVRVLSSLLSSLPLSHASLSTLVPRPTISTSSTSTSPLDAFIRSVHVALNSGLSPETLVANIRLIVQERAAAPSSLPILQDEFLSQ